MAIYEKDGSIYRFGQNNCYGYGEKITVNKIKDLSTEIYEEEIVSEICISDYKGPVHYKFYEKNGIGFL